MCRRYLEKKILTTSSVSLSSFESPCRTFLLAFSTTGGAPIVVKRAKKQSRLMISLILNLKDIYIRVPT